MSDKEKKVPVEELTAYERWELPQIGSGNDSSVFDRARARIQRQVKPLTAEDLENIRKEAYQAGFDEGKQAGFEQGRNEGVEQGKKEGHQQGLNQGLADGQSRIDQAITQLQSCMQQLANPIAEQQQIVEQAMLNVSLAISRAVIHRELKLDSAQISKTIENAVHDLPDFSSGVKVHLNASDIPHAQKASENLGVALELIGDNRIQPGGCTVETSSQLVDYTIEKRFQKTVHAMLFAASNAGGAPVLDTSTSINELSDYSSATLDEAEEELSHESQIGNEQAIEPAPDDQTVTQDHSNIPESGDTSGDDGNEPV